MCGPSSQNQNLQTKCERTKDQRTNIWIVSGHDFSEAGLPKENSCCLLATIKAIVSSPHVTDGHPGLWALDVLLFSGSKCTLKHKAVQSNVYLPNEELTNDVEKLGLLRELSSPILIQNTVFIYTGSADRVTAPTCSWPTMTYNGYRMPLPWFS